MDGDSRMLGDGKVWLLMKARGFSLVEVMVTLTIAGILLALGISSFTTMMASTRSRSATESILAGLQRARSEAIARNAPMRFQLVDSLTAECDYSATSMLWVVSQTDQEAPHGLVHEACDALPYLPSDDCLLGKAGACTDDAWIAAKSSALVHQGLTVTALTAAAGAAATTITFNALGKVLPNIGGTATLGYLTVVPDEPSAKTWAIQINTFNGSIKMCDPALAAGAALACS